MRLTNIILSLCTLFICTSCIDRAGFWRTESALARVGDSSLYPREIAMATPEGLSAADSAAFVAVYIERWTQREAKLIEAEKIFASSSKEIEDKVEEYRRKLLLDKLNRYILEQRWSSDISQSQIEEYYNHNRSQFIVEKPLVQYRLVRHDSLFTSSANLEKLLSSQKESDKEDLRSICEKNRLLLVEVESQWGEAEELLAMLPYMSEQRQQSLLTSNKVNRFSSNGEEYLLKITDRRNSGDITPLPVLEEMIKGILLKREQNQILLDYENELYHKALNRGRISFPSTSHIN